jgi:hypothetical protein
MGTQITSGKSGSRISCMEVEAELFEYPDLSATTMLHNANGISQDEFTYLCNTHPLLDVSNKYAPVPVDGKWVYFFKKGSGSISLQYELYPSIKGDSQTFEYVSWKQEALESNRSTFPRNNSGTLNILTIDGNAEYYVLLSQIQLPLHRIDFYIANPGKLAQRAIRIAPDNTGELEPIQIRLIDFKATVEILCDHKNKAVEKYNKHFGDKQYNTKRYLADMVTEIHKNRSKIEKWLDYSAVTAFIKKDDAEIKKLMKAIDNAKGLLKDWKLSPGYTMMCDDYNGTEESELAIIDHVAEVTAEDELEYLAAIGKDTKSFFHRLFKDDQPFLFHRKLSALSANDKAQDLLSKYIVGRFLAMMPGMKTKVYKTVNFIKIQQIVIVEFEEVLKRMVINLPELSSTGSGGWFVVYKKDFAPKIHYDFVDVPQSRQVLVSAKTNEYYKAMDEWKQHVEKAGKACNAILLAIETINMISAMKGFDSKGDAAENTLSIIDMGGSIADAVGATDFLLQSKITKKYGEAAAKKFFARVNLVGSVADYVGALNKSYKASSEGKMGLALSHSVLGLAATAGGVSSVLALQGSGAMAFGIGTGGWGFIAIGLALAGSGLVWFFTEEDLEEWAKESEWGEADRRKSLDQQARNLHQILCSFSVECYIHVLNKQGTEIINRYGTVIYQHSYDLSFKIVPGLWKKGTSRFRVGLKVEKNNIPILSEAMVINKSFSLPDASTTHLAASNSRPAAIIRRFSESEMTNVPDLESDTLSFECSVQLDLNGDGSEMVPADKPLKEDGAVERRAFDFK